MIVVGDIFVDVIVDAPTPPVLGGDVVMTQPVTELPGGSALNVVSHFSRAMKTNGTEVEGKEKALTFLGAAGTDRYGNVIMEHIKKLRNVKFINGNEERNDPTAHCVCLVTHSPRERSFLSYQGCLQSFDPDVSNHELGHLHLSGLNNLVGLNVMRMVSSFERATSTSLIVQFGHDWDRCKPLLPHTTYLFASIQEVLSIASAKTLDEAKQFYVSDGGPQFTIITKGEEGSEIVKRGAGVILSTEGAHLDAASVVDPTGAGDCFAAAFLYAALVERKGLADCLLEASAYGAACCTMIGASSEVNVRDVENLKKAVVIRSHSPSVK